MKAVSILRQFHDTILSQIASLETFLDETHQYFETNDRDLDEHWRRYFDRIRRENNHLRRWERRLAQRMQRFDGMKDGVCDPIVSEGRSTTLTLTQAYGFVCSSRKSPFDETRGRHRRPHEHDCGTAWFYFPRMLDRPCANKFQAYLPVNLAAVSF